MTKASVGGSKNSKDVMYDADDILNLCRIESEKYVSHENTQTELSWSGTWGCNNFYQLSCLPLPTCFRNPVYAHDIGKRIKTLNSMLDKISEEKSLYGLVSLCGNLSDESMVSEISEKTSSIVESDLVGTKIIDDTRKLVQLLTKPDGSENVLVFAIVGLGGIGKTTLAQQVFNDTTIGQFSLKIWIFRV
ncbi:uncharacterized protein A4U43_C07F5080 [Asparagus officinalis]|uniref:NB-ARC domain-containing protein n=1 Tax=Asparagus officinalis TaxID=4686 RepID=A0A5P1E9N5_ASPOF|nr:uncharacterized protein A4U43_C07F5080 [Asparagus officinalis]